MISTMMELWSETFIYVLKTYDHPNRTSVDVCAGMADMAVDRAFKSIYKKRNKPEVETPTSKIEESDDVRRT